ncbi:MAG TPA: DUF445 domain-containing protein [Gemmatimonadaceae bacterium]|nr:DUF445 domain-containing protein [Gemmatimonadaceae bacterium]
MTTLAPPLLDEPAKQLQLERMKRRATALLVIAAVVFVVARLLEPRFPWLGYLRATAEAAMVGGVADWFAVTALFRQPMGLPIPHTAIIPARKDRIGRSLGGFVQRNFLSRDVVASRLAAVRAGEHLARWVSQPENARLISRHVAAGLAGATRVMRDEDVRDAIEKHLLGRIRATRVAPIIGNALSLLTAGDRHQELLDRAIVLVARFVSENEELIRDRIRAESPWWIPERVDDKIHDKIVSGIERTLQDVSINPDHPLRGRFDHALDEFIERLRTSPEVIARAEQIKAEVLDSPAVREYSRGLWDDVKHRLVRYAERSDDEGPGAVERGLVALGNAVLADPTLMAKVESWITEMVLYAVEQARDEVAHLIEHTVAAWDPDDTSRKIELQIGRDLQFIRINGTLVGGLVGLLLYSIGKLF